MGYIPNLYPSRRWFAGYVFITFAKNILEEAKSANTAWELTRFYEAEISMIRGIRSVLKLCPDGENGDHEMLKEALSLLPEDLRQEAKTKYFDFTRKIELRSFYSHYFYIRDSSGRKSEFSSPTADHDSLVLDYKVEYMTHMNQLMDLAENIFFHVYQEDRGDDLFESFTAPHEFTDIDDFKKYWDRAELAHDEEEIEKAYELGDDNNPAWKLANKVREEACIDNMQSMHRDYFRDGCRETAAIWN